MIYQMQPKLGHWGQSRGFLKEVGGVNRAAGKRCWLEKWWSQHVLFLNRIQSITDCHKAHLSSRDPDASKGSPMHVFCVEVSEALLPQEPLSTTSGLVFVMHQRRRACLAQRLAISPFNGLCIAANGSELNQKPTPPRKHHLAWSFSKHLGEGCATVNNLITWETAGKVKITVENTTKLNSDNAQNMPKKGNWR